MGRGKRNFEIASELSLTLLPCTLRDVVHYRVNRTQELRPKARRRPADWSAKRRVVTGD
jgi:hypothetical protein